MELKEKQGYKKTKIGLIPWDWEVESFGDVADKRIKNSITGGPFGSNLKTTDYTPDGIQIIQLQNIGDGKFIDESVLYTSIAKAEELKSCNIYAGEIILSKMGDPVARACLMPSKASRYLMASDGIRLVVDEKRYDKKFVFNYINSKYFRNRAIDISTGSTRQRIGLPDLKGLKFIKPPLSEQKNIAIALSDVDELINNLDKLITKKKALKQGAMQQLLTPPHKGGKRLEGFSGDWVEIKLGEVSQMNSGGTPSSKISEFYDGEINWVSITDISNAGKFIYSSVKKITEKGLENSSARLFPINTLLLAMYASIGKCTIAKAEVTTSQAILGITVQKSLDIEFLYYYFIHKKNELINQGQHGTQANLNKGMVQDIKLFLPNIEEQKAISEILSDMDLEIEQLESKKAKYQSVKLGMMQELLTGKTRLI
jgi:type I restriction enzyme S subunit